MRLFQLFSIIFTFACIHTHVQAEGYDKTQHHGAIVKIACTCVPSKENGEIDQENIHTTIHEHHLSNSKETMAHVKKAATHPDTPTLFSMADGKKIVRHGFDKAKQVTTAVVTNKQVQAVAMKYGKKAAKMVARKGLDYGKKKGYIPSSVTLFVTKHVTPVKNGKPDIANALQEMKVHHYQCGKPANIETLFSFSGAVNKAKNFAGSAVHHVANTVNNVVNSDAFSAAIGAAGEIGAAAIGAKFGS